MISKDLEAHLIRLEQEIVAAQQRRDFAAVEALLADDFREIGSSGRLFTKADAVCVISEVQILDCAFDHFQFLPIDDKCVIVMYVATARRTQDGREHMQRAWRSSTWVKKAKPGKHSFIKQPLCPQSPDIRKLKSNPRPPTCYLRLPDAQSHFGSL
jgi:hypothetical protein